MINTTKPVDKHGKPHETSTEGAFFKMHMEHLQNEGQ